MPPAHWVKDTSAMLKIARFTVAKSLEPHGLPSHVLVFSTFSGKCVVLAEQEWRNITGSLAQSDDTVSEVVARARARLAQLGILSGADVDDRRIYEERFERDRYNPRAIFPILAVTTACNIACTYCYEEGVAGRVMTPQVVGGVLGWMRRRIERDGIRQVNPILFGGEPLLCPDRLFELMEGLRVIVDENPPATCEFSITSNGILLTRELARGLADRGLASIQISLDGPPRIHNERRIGHRGQPSFDQSLAAIHLAAETIPHVTLKVNFDRHNRASIGALFDFLVDEGLADRITVKLETIALQIGSGTVHDPAYVIPPESPIRINPHTAHTTPCMFLSHHGVIIGPRGNIYKCISLVGRETFRVGTVFDGDGEYTAEYARQMDGTKKVTECWDENCPYIPVCAGGCAYESIVRTGRYDLRFCTKENLDAFHYKRYLLKHEDQLVKLGMSALAVSALRLSAMSPGGRTDGHTAPVSFRRARPSVGDGSG
jgi:uncharacterized protein